jgi:hypothetical protein
MARIDYWQYLLDRKGRPLQDAKFRVYLAGTSTEADIYLNATFGSVTKSSFEDLKTDKFGFIQFWVGDQFEVEGGYTVDQQFRVVWWNDIDSIVEEIDNLYVFTPVRPIDASDDIKGDPSNKDFNRVISNNLGYKWEAHVDSIVPSASPHGLQPVEFFDLDETKNRVISNKLGYQMWQMAERASYTPIDISAARYTQQAITSMSFDVSTGLYYGDVTHNYNNYYPIVRVSDLNTDYQVRAKKIEAISPDTTRIWMVDNSKIRVLVLG